MSSILDALKKSERQRSLGRDLIFRNAAPDAAPRLTGFAIAVLVTLLMLAVAIGVLLFSLREPELPELISPQAVLPPPAGSSTISAQGGSDSLALSAPLAPPDAVRSVESKKRSDPQMPAALPRPVTPKPVKPADAPRDPVHALPVQAIGAVLWLSSLPQVFRSSLPPLAVNIHVYSPDESQRILYINNRQARQGERIEGGVVVEEIVHDGVVLQFRGQRFKLPRPS